MASFWLNTRFVTLVWGAFLLSGCGTNEPSDQGPLVGNFDWPTVSAPAGDYTLNCRAEDLSHDTSNPQFKSSYFAQMPDGTERLLRVETTPVPCP